MENNSEEVTNKNITKLQAYAIPFRTAYLTIKHGASTLAQQRNYSRSFFTKENKCHPLTGIF